MPKGKKRVPKYAFHKPTGQARVQIDGKSVYLGKYNSPESRLRYEELIAELQQAPETQADATALTIGALCVAYIGHCRKYYRKNGKETSEVACVRSALRPLCALHSETLVANFSPLVLQKVREEMIRRGWVRTSINRSILRIRKMVKWGVATEAIRSPDVLARLKAVDGLQKGRSEANESEPVRPVSLDLVNAIREHVRPAVWSMIQLQLLTGMRPGEVRLMRLADIDRSGQEWVYRPGTHKLEHRGIDRAIIIGPDGQSIISDVMTADPSRYLFESMPGTPYTKDSYCRTISRACRRAEIEHWHPNQLRHTAATDIRKRFGLEASRVVLGHTTVDTTLTYAERDLEVAKSVIRQIG